MRREGFTDGATYEEIREMSLSSSSAVYDLLATDTPYNEEDFTQLKNFYSSHNDGA